MPDLSEFTAFVAERSGITKPRLVAEDIFLHRILEELYTSQRLRENYLFKGGSCLVKCYFGYYRFSIDLDFTWRNQELWKVGEKELRRRLHEEIRAFGRVLETVSKQVGIEFVNSLGNRRYFDFGGGGRMVTFKLWKGEELVKVQVSFLEEILFPSRSVVAKTLLDRTSLTKDEETYFKDFLGFYTPLNVEAYDEREILCEKVRAILTRRTQKLRDFYDIFMLKTHGFEAEDLSAEIIRKTKALLYYKKYRSNLETNKKALTAKSDIFEDPFERELFVEDLSSEYEQFLPKLLDTLRAMANRL